MVYWLAYVPCFVFQVCSSFDPESCHDFALETKRGGEEERHRKKTRMKKVEKRKELKKAERSEEEEERERGTKREREDFNFWFPSGSHRG